MLVNQLVLSCWYALSYATLPVLHGQQSGVNPFKDLIIVLPIFGPRYETSSIGVRFSPQLVTWLAKKDTDYLKLVFEAMQFTSQYITDKIYDVYVTLGFDGRISFGSFSPRFSMFPDERWDDKLGYCMICYNVHSIDQQLILLAGLSALHYLAFTDLN